MAIEGGAEDCTFLGEPEWEPLPGGRVRCVQTGHEMPLAAQPTYGSTKKCRSALFAAALQKRTPPLNFFDQSPFAKDKIICKLTGVVLNKKEDAVWKHMLGKKFEQKLVEKETENEMSRKDVEMTESSPEKPSSKNAVDVGRIAGNGEKSSEKKEKASTNSEEIDGEEVENACSDSSDFWIPPVGARWDFDNGSNDRWTAPLHNDPKHNMPVIRPTEGAVREDGLNSENSDTEMFDGAELLLHSASSDDSEAKIRTKRTSRASRSRSQKKSWKRLRVESNKQNGVQHIQV